MEYVYILKSKKDGKLYIGYTKDLKRRFRQHQQGQVASTKPRVPFELIYYESYKSRDDAKTREHQLKKGKRAYEQLKNRIRNCMD